ncbi:hypothetical protein [Arthrobacter sp. HLT1-20]
MTIAFVAFALTFSLRSAGLLYGSWVLLLFGVLLVLIPVSRHLSGRILWTLPVIFGLVPLLWWIPLDWPPNVRSTMLLSTAVAVVVFCGLWFPTFRGEGRRLLPQVSGIDAVPLLAAAGAVFVTFQDLTVRRVDDAMALLLMAWDNASHFDIFHMQRIHGTVLPLAGPTGDGSRWAFSDYPQGFHSTLVLLSELARKNDPGVWETELITFANFSAVLNIAIVVLIVAAVCSLPALRRAPAIGVPIAVLVGSGWLFGPGALASMHGFSNFFFTTALVGAAIVLFHSMERVFDPLPLIAASACLSAVMQNWVLLGVFLLPCVVALLFVTPKGRWKASRGELLTVILLASVVALSAATAASQLLTVKAEGILYAIGGVPLPDFGLLIASLLFLAGAAFLLGGRGRPGAPSAVRTRWSLGSIWVALALAVAMAAAQLAKTGALSYYMQKFSIALALLALLGLALAANGLLEPGRPLVHQRARQRPGRLLAASMVVSIGFTQVFGFTLPLKEIGMPPTAESGLQAAKQRAAVSTGSVAGGRLLDAVRRSEGLAGPVMYLTTNPNDVDVILAQQWFDGLRGNYTEHGWTLSLNMFPLSGGPENLRKVIVDIKSEDPAAVIVVDPENQAALDQIMASLN